MHSIANPSAVLFLMAISPLLTVFGFLTCRTTTMSTSDILFLLGLGLHLAVVLRLVTSASEVDAVFENVLEIVHGLNDGRDGHL